jgi:hypothetical protein
MMKSIDFSSITRAQDAMMKSIDFSSITRAQDAMMKSIDFSSVTRAQDAMMKSIDFSSVTRAQDAMMKSIDFSSVTRAQDAMMKSIDFSSITRAQDAMMKSMDFSSVIKVDRISSVIDLSSKVSFYNSICKDISEVFMNGSINSIDTGMELRNSVFTRDTFNIEEYVSAILKFLEETFTIEGFKDDLQSKIRGYVIGFIMLILGIANQSSDNILNDKILMENYKLEIKEEIREEVKEELLKEIREENQEVLEDQEEIIFQEV